MKPTVGRVVHFVLPDGGRNAGEHRPAVVVRVWTDTCVQLQVFFDGTNDGAQGDVGWRTSVALDEDEKRGGTWHWPEREEP